MAEDRRDVTAEVLDVLPEEEFRVCFFRIAEDLYAISVDAVTEILIPQKIFPVPTTPGHVLGVINLRGNIIPIVDIRPILSLPQQNASGQIVILRHRQVPIGVLVDSVVEIASVPKGRFVELPSEHSLAQAGRNRNRMLKAIIQREHGMAALLDVDKVFEEIKLA